MAYKGQLNHTKEYILLKCKNAFGDIYSYENMEYINAEVPIVITCKTHGDFTRRIYDHVSRKRGCPKCIKQFHIDYTKPGILYYLQILHEGTYLYKIGVTSKSIEERFYRWKLDKIKVLSIQAFATVKEAISVEQNILSKYKEHIYIGSPILNTGNTELFTIDILELTSASYTGDSL